MGRVLFTATDLVNGTELWSTDGTEAGTFMVEDLSPGRTPAQGPKGTEFSDIVSLGDNAVFVARSYDDQFYKLYASDGVSLQSIGEFAGAARFVAQFDGKVFFTSHLGMPDGTGDHLFQTDGTAAGTFEVPQSGIELHTNFNNDVGAAALETGAYFFTKTTEHTYDTLYNLFEYRDGSLVDTGIAAGTQYGIVPKMLAVPDGFVFANYTEETGTELWFSDGTAAGTHIVKDIMPGALGQTELGATMAAIPVDGKVLFTANDGSGTSLWLTDGTEAGTRIVYDFFEGSSQSPNYLSLTPGDNYGRLQNHMPITVGDHTLFVVNDGSIPDYTWAYDSKTETVSPLHFIAEDGREVRSESGAFFNVGGDIYFAGFTMDGGESPEYVDVVALFKAEGGTWETQLVKDINTSSGQGAYGIAIDDIQAGIDYAGKFLFPMYDRITYDSFGHPLFNSEPWISDGTEAGTNNIKEIAPGTTLFDGTDNEFAGSSPGFFTVVGDPRTSGLADRILLSMADYGGSVDGMGGVDTADYSGFSAGIEASLRTGRSTLRADAGDDAPASLTELAHIENLVGTGHDDVLTGDDGDNVLSGDAGFDTLIGGAGNDILDGGVNSDNQGDILLGGAGDDTYHVDSSLDLVDEGFVFPDAGWGGTDTVVSTANWYWDSQSVGEIDRIAEDAADPGGAGVTFVGGIFDNVLYGHSGTDILFGRGGNDVYVPGDGIDWISLSTLGLTDANAYAGVDGHNTVIVTPRTSGGFSYDILFDFDPAKDKVDVSAYGDRYASGADVLSHAADDGAGSSYIALGDGLDYLYFVGLTKAELDAGDFVV